MVTVLVQATLQENYFFSNPHASLTKSQTHGTQKIVVWMIDFQISGENKFKSRNPSIL